MTKSDFLKCLQDYKSPDVCSLMAAYLNKISRGRNFAFTEDVFISNDSSHLLDTDSDVYHIVFLEGCGYTYIRNDDSGELKCALTPARGNNERKVFFAHTPEEFCNVMINRIILRQV